MNSGRCPRLILFASIVLLLSLAAWSQQAAVPQSIYGRWYTYPLGNPMTDPVRHEFRHNSTTGADEMVVTRACPYESRVVVAKAVAPIEVSEDSIRVMKGATDSEVLQGTTVCEASITAAMLSYSFSEDGEHLILTNPGGSPDFLELARETKESETPTPQRLYGTWLLPAVNGRDMRVQIRWVFYSTAERQDKVRQIAVCTKGNDSLVSDVDASVRVSKDEIRVLESVSHEQHAGDFSCQANIVAVTWHYMLAPTGLTLTLSTAGSKPMVLTREDESGLN